MSIQELYAKINHILQDENERLFSALLIILVAVASFGLGRLSVHTPQRAASAETRVENKNIEQTTKNEITTPADTYAGNYVASKNSDKYHLPWCGGAARIKPENQIWFTTKEEAEAAGYSPAGNCEGL